MSQGYKRATPAIPPRFSHQSRTTNGAGIAADPTLTDVWPSSFNTSVQGTQTWHPMFPRPAIREWSSGSFTGARTGIRIYPPLGPVSAALRSEDRSPALPSRASTGGSAAWPSTGGRRLERSHRVPVRRPLRGAIFGNRPGWPGPQRETFALPSSTRLASGQRPWHEGLEKRVDRTRCLFPVSENPCLSDR